MTTVVETGSPPVPTTVVGVPGHLPATGLQGDASLVDFATALVLVGAVCWVSSRRRKNPKS